ncbi:hypothetical protein [Gymnodinialimonas ulvae]|uniref:hypothetical protein n=1 Tax=Gymnodinialimonas ulvae TaxID=3126504 RepID=UPI0030B1AADB
MAIAQVSGPQQPFEVVQITPSGDALVRDARGAYLCALDRSGATEVVFEDCRVIVGRDETAALEPSTSDALAGIDALTDAYIETLSDDPFLIGAAFTNVLRANGCSIEPSAYASEDALLGEVFTELAPITGLEVFPFPFAATDLPAADEERYTDIVDRMQTVFAQGYVAMLSIGTITLENDVLSLTEDCP